MTGLLMCITLVCFRPGDRRYMEYPETKWGTFYEQDLELNLITMQSYERYRIKDGNEVESNWRACYAEEDAREFTE